MDCVEVIVKQEYTDAEVYIDVYAALINKKNAAEVLELFCNDLPLQNFGLNHLKRVQPLDRTDKTGPLQIIVCPVQRFEEAPEHIRDLCGDRRIVTVSRLAPACRQEFEAWNKCWPINFHASHLEKQREKGLTTEDMEQMRIAAELLVEEERLFTKCGGGIMVNPINGKVVTTTSEAMLSLQQRLDRNNSKTVDDPVFSSMYTPTMVCIEGVAAVVRGELQHRVGSLSENAYLCSGLDLYLTNEPDLMASMALVHSRIRRVFFRYPDNRMGALRSGRGHIHCLRSLNHHYRVFQLVPSET